MEELTLIGRAEQADTARGLSSSYACQNCCPDSFSEAWVTPGEVHGFPGDQTQFLAVRQDQTCYGELTAPFETFANFSSLDPNVAFCGSNGLTTAMNPGNTTIRANFGRVFFYGGPQCATSFANYLTGAVCDVLALRANRGRIQAQGSNPRVEVSRSWSQDHPPSKATAESWLDAVWNDLTPSQQRDRQRAYEDAKQFINDAPQYGYEAYPFPIRRSFKDPQRRDPSARIDIDIFAGHAFRGPF